MSDLSPTARSKIERIDAHPAVEVNEMEYRRLLGYPRNHLLTPQALELAAWARQWYAAQGRPWVYLREAELRLNDDALELDGVAFQSKQLHDHLREAGARRVMLVAVSAGRECEEHARQLWQEGKPDEYFFLEVFGSAVVEHIVAATSGRICDLAEHNGLVAVPHYSPGYSGWDVADQNKLFELITRGATQSFAGPLEVLSSGMLKPKKSLLAVFGLATRSEKTLTSARLIPCQNCAFSPCQYRRAAYRHAVAPAETAPIPQVAAAAQVDSPTYTVNVRALKKWAGERVRLGHREDGSVEAAFRFDGTTCSNMGQPLAFDYQVTLSGPQDGYRIIQTACRPAAGDEGHTQMCAYLSDPDALLHSIAGEKPLLGQPLSDVLNWTRPTTPSSGCYCTADSRAHKWGLAFEAIHYALTQSSAGIPPRAANDSISSPS